MEICDCEKNIKIAEKDLSSKGKYDIIYRENKNAEHKVQRLRNKACKPSSVENGHLSLQYVTTLLRRSLPAPPTDICRANESVCGVASDRVYSEP